MPRTRRAALTALTVAAVSAGSLLAAQSAHAALNPTSASGTKDCRGKGTIVLRTTMSRYDGVKMTTSPVGSPVVGWTRKVKAQPTDPTLDDVSMAIRTPSSYARWSMVNLRGTPALGLSHVSARCTLDTVSGTALESRTGTTKTCPAGQTVLIVADSYKPTGHFWTPSGSTTRYREAHPGGGLLTTSFTDTGVRAITSWKVTAYHKAGLSDGGKRFEAVHTACSGAEGIS